jgi:hypothetical protein
MTAFSSDKIQQLNLFYLKKYEELKTSDTIIFKSENTTEFRQIEITTIEMFMAITAQVFGIIFSDRKGDMDKAMRDYTSLSATGLKVLYDAYGKITDLNEILKKDANN